MDADAGSGYELGAEGYIAGSAQAFIAAARDRHPATQQLVRYFSWSHLPEPLQAISRPIGLLALGMLERLPDGPELSAGLRKLLEAKDCFVRQALPDVRM